MIPTIGRPVDDARQTILKAAHDVAEGIAGPETQALAPKLEKVTGVSLAELAASTMAWPE